MNKKPKHLGGQVVGNVDEGIVRALHGHFNVASLVDIGCGDGVATRIYAGMGISVTGVDGDWTVLPKDRRFIRHDFTEGALDIGPFDLAYSVEFLEHLREEYLSNAMLLFATCRYAVVTAAPPGRSGYHHVNCRLPDYWKQVFADYGMIYDDATTQWLRHKSTMVKASGRRAGKRFRAFREWGLFFYNRWGLFFCNRL